MKKILILALVLVLAAACLIACGNTDTPAETEITTDVSAYKYEGDYILPKHILTQEGIDALPMKHKDMTVEEMRDTVTQFYLYSKQIVWTAGSTLKYCVSESHGNSQLNAGLMYEGFHYESKGTGNIYRLLEFMDPATGVVDAEKWGANAYVSGNQCSASTYWAWARVMNSSKNYLYTRYMTRTRNFLPIGDYTYDFTTEEWLDTYGTREVVADNGEQKMFECYALTQPGDGFVYCNGGIGHTIIVTGETVVVRNEDGTIDPEESYIIYADQNQTTKPETNEEGDQFIAFGKYNNQRTFQKLYDTYYIPFTFGEFTGEDPVEDTEASCSHTGATITREQLIGTKVTANYAISDTYASVYNDKGVEVYKVAIHALFPSVYEMTISDDNANKDTTVWGSWDNVKSGYTVKIYAQLGTGERPTLWEGTVA